ncbi:MAG: PDDEXK nuclease domain-containing protein [Oscillospiraceae bacterium]|nr:PDDEXK nuclease domain-containing protein [Oscillospiraceae bacterium]
MADIVDYTVTDELAAKIEKLIDGAKKQTVTQINTIMVQTYYEIGQMIVESEQQGEIRAGYGKQVLKRLSEKLNGKFGKGFSVDNLENMRRFYLTYSGKISETASRNSEAEKSETLSRISGKPNFTLSWSHYVFLMRIDNPAERSFYETETIREHWSLRELKRQFNSALYERLALSKDKQAILDMAKRGIIVRSPEDIVKDPYILEFLGLPEETKYSESTLEQKIIDKLQMFLLELGKGYTFVGRQVRLTFDEKHFYCDLVFFNRLLQCFVLIDLKIGEITHQDLGQMQMYVHYYDRHIKLPTENPTIGIVLCKKKDDTLVELTLPEDNTQIFASKYQTILPNKEELTRLLDEKIGGSEGAGDE